MSVEAKIEEVLQLQHLGQTKEALNCCLQLLAKDLTDYRIHFLLGMLYQQLEKPLPAINHFSRAAELYPDLASIHYNLGVLHYSLGRLEEAAEAYQTAAALAPDDPDIFFNLALTWKNLGRHSEAKTANEKALAINPDDSEAHYNLGVLLREMHEPEEAISSFEKAVALSPSYLAAHKHLAALFHLLDRREKALAAYQTVLTLNPGNESALHMVAALTGETPAAPPLSYVEKLFDQFSNNYEETMVEKLECAVEKQLRTLLDRHVNSTGFARGLDMGCGTGLSGLAFNDLVQHFTGIDISTGMLIQAREKEVYDEVVQSDILSFLQNTTELYDFFLAADVLVYLGDLQPLFKQVRQTAHPGACFVFSVEKCEEGYVLQESGRYAHAESYVKKLAGQCGFDFVCCQSARLRKDKGEWIKGNLYLLRVGF